MACDECRSYFAHPALLTLGRERTAEEELLAARLPEVWEVLRSWRENPTSGLYVERLALRCRSCGQQAETSDDAWYGGEFSPVGGR